MAQIKGCNIKFFVVTKPSKFSTLEDILFESDPIHFANQIRGGLRETEVFGFYIQKNNAEHIAKELLESVPVV